MKNKPFLKSLYHAAEIVERINKSKQKSKFGKILGEYEYLAINYNCKEHNGILCPIAIFLYIGALGIFVFVHIDATNKLLTFEEIYKDV